MKESKALAKAREYERQKLQETDPALRPICHFSTPTGWHNDPNGLSVYGGEYHLFYQYHPYSLEWGLMHWGHAVSEDMIRWKYLPAALAPDEDFDRNGCFSGSAVEKDGKHVLIYTGVNGISGIHEQCIAVGDGMDYEKIAQNPVAGIGLLPVDCNLGNFRDPKVWKENGSYFAVLGSSDVYGAGQAILLSSANLYQWEYETVLDKSTDREEDVWECPDFFPLEDKRVLMASPMKYPLNYRPEGPNEFFDNRTIFIVGNYDAKKRHFRRESRRIMDEGFDFYAPQSFETPDKRRVAIGWLKSVDGNLLPKELGWSGIMSIPRELTLREGIVCQWPVRELENYYGDSIAAECGLCDEEKSFKGINGRECNMEIEWWVESAKKLDIKLAGNEEYETLLSYDVEQETFLFDRSKSGTALSCRNRKKISFPMDGRQLKLRILLDKYSVEIFLGQGEKVMTYLIPTPMEAGNIVFGALGKAVLRVKKNNLSTNMPRLSKKESLFS